jgi:signal transduction histidine kinase
MRRLGITAKLAIHSALILIGLGLVATAYSVSQLRGLLYQQMVERAEADTLRWIEANYDQIILLGDSSRDEQSDNKHISYDPPLDALKKEGKWIAYVVLLDREGRALRELAVPQGLRDDGPAPEVSGVTSRLAEKKDSVGRRYFELTTPIPASRTGMSPELDAMFGLALEAQPARSETWGEVQVGIDQGEFEGRLADLIGSNIRLAALLVLAAVIASFGFAKRIVKPVTAIGRAADRIAAGNLSERVSHGAELRDEVGDLVRNFNHMAGRLEESRNEMNLLYAGLEEKVRERTAELEEVNRKLQEQDRLKSEFLSTVSHELRTPLTSIKAHAEILLDAHSLNPERYRRGLEIINESSDRLTRLISDLLDLRKIENGIVSWKMTPADLRELVQESVDLMRPHATERNIEIEIVKPGAQPVYADSDRIQEVITNLIGNAIKFCPPGSQIQVLLSRTVHSGPHSAQPGDYAQVAVADTGPGMEAKDSMHVFEPFYRGEKTRSASSGTGLGLAISRQIVLHHGGEIWVESELGAGSTFYFTMPLQPPGDSANLQTPGTQAEKV